MSIVILPPKKCYRQVVGCHNKNITKYNPKGLTRKQLGMNSHQYKMWVKKGIKV